MKVGEYIATYSESTSRQENYIVLAGLKLGTCHLRKDKRMLGFGSNVDGTRLWYIGNTALIPGAAYW